MKRVLVSSAGGAPATNFVRSLRDAPEDFQIVGVDANKYTLQRAETDEKYLVPRITDLVYFDVLRDIIRETGTEFVHCQMSYEMLAISRMRQELGVRTFLPDHRTIEICEDKFQSFECWSKAGLPTPRTRLIESEIDLDAVFRDFGPKVWFREVRGSAGRNALPTNDKEEARRWIDQHDGWGKFTGAECLNPQSVTWLSIWHQGELVVAQGRKRLYWEFADRSPSGVTGITGTGVTLADPVLDDLCQRAVKAIDQRPNGLFGVDLTYDSKGQPNLTEINIGRFFTTHYFFTAAGLNMPYIFVKLAFGETPPLPERHINPLPSGLAWIRGMDTEPVLMPVEQIDVYETELEDRLARLKGDEK